MPTRSPEFRRELGWLTTTLVCSLLVGFVTGFASWFVPLACFLHATWLLWRLERLGRWLADGARSAKAPPTVGLGNRIVGLVHHMRNDSRRQKRKHKTALAQFKDLSAALPDATIVLDEQREIRWANPAAKALLNIDLERDRGQRIDNLIRVPGFLEAPLHGDGGQDLEMEWPGGSGRTLALRFVSSGNRTSMLIARNVTQRVRIREMRKRFVDDVSHELRTPLTVIAGYVEMLQDDFRNDKAPTREALEQVADNTARMRGIVEDLLALSRLEGEPLGADEGEPTDVSALLRAIVEAAEDTLTTTDSTSAESTATRFTLDLDESIGLRGVESALWSACNNLVINAVRYAGSGSCIDVFWGYDENGTLCCRVRDDGPGIEAWHIPRLSERFYRVEKHRGRDSGGTGLGLAIVKHAVQLHGGELAIRSIVGKGSTFCMQFPASRVIALGPRATPCPLPNEIGRVVAATDARPQLQQGTQHVESPPSSVHDLSAHRRATR